VARPIVSAAMKAGTSADRRNQILIAMFLFPIDFYFSCYPSPRFDRQLP
jgi:hypothetical protein